MRWNYKKGYVDVNMPGYVHKQLNKFQHPKPTKAQFAPHKWSIPSYGKASQYVTPDTSTPLDEKGKKLIQSITGAFLYYGRAVDPTILPALTSIVSAQAQPTEHTMEACTM